MKPMELNLDAGHHALFSALDQVLPQPKRVAKRKLGQISRDIPVDSGNYFIMERTEKGMTEGIDLRISPGLTLSNRGALDDAKEKE